MKYASDSFTQEKLLSQSSGMVRIAENYLNYDKEVIRPFDSKFTEAYETLIGNINAGEGADFKSKYFQKDVVHEVYGSQYEYETGTPSTYTTREFMTLDEIMGQDGIDNIPLVKDYMNVKMSKILEESLKNGAISQEKFDELSAKGDYDSFREVFGGFYTGTLGEYQYVMGSKDEKWYSLKKIADTAMQILGGVVAVVGVISIFVTAGATLPIVLGVGSAILGAYGSVKYGYQFITEKDWMTGRDLSDEEKWLSGLQAIASMITLGRGVGLTANAMSQAKGASEVVKNTAKFFAGKNVDRVLTVADYAVDGFVAGTKIYYGQPIDQVLFDKALALGVNFAISKGMKNLKKYATENDLVYNIGKRTESVRELEIEFNANPDHDYEEFKHQLSNQEKGLNDLSIQDYLDNRAEFLQNGRSIEGTKLQKAFREDYKLDMIADLRSQGYTKNDATRITNDFMKTQAVLHDPDQIVGGFGNKIAGLGDSRVNTSIGSQWKYRVEYIDDYVAEISKGLSIEQLKETKLNIKLIP